VGSRRTLALSPAAILTALLIPPTAAARLLAFKSPTGNITCVMSTERDQPQFAQCEMRSNQTGYSVRRRGRVQLYDRAAEDDLAGRRFVLRYGHALRLSVFVCTSRFSGMTCRSTLSGHGFSISKQRQRLF
jgi:hypothetical protein